MLTALGGQFHALYIYILCMLSNGNVTWRHFLRWLHWKLPSWQLAVCAVTKILSRWHNFRFSYIKKAFLCKYFVKVFFPNTAAHTISDVLLLFLFFFHTYYFLYLHLFFFVLFLKGGQEYVTVNNQHTRKKVTWIWRHETLFSDHVMLAGLRFDNFKRAFIISCRSWQAIISCCSRWC